jgi:hypothetical protein
MDIMTAPTPRRPWSTPAPSPAAPARPSGYAELRPPAGAGGAPPSAAATTRFPSAAVFAAALEASSLGGAERARCHDGDAAALRELRVLLEENLTALRAVYEDQRQTIAKALRTVDSARAEIGALAQPDAPWVTALDQTRALIRAAFAEIAAEHAQRR